MNSKPHMQYYIWNPHNNPHDKGVSNYTNMFWLPLQCKIAKPSDTERHKTSSMWAWVG